MKLRKSHNSLKFGGMMYFTMKRITVWHGHTQLMFAFSHDLARPRVLSFSECLVFAYINSLFRDPESKAQVDLRRETKPKDKTGHKIATQKTNITKTALHWNIGFLTPCGCNYTNPGYGLSLVDTLWNAGSYRQPLEQEGNPMTWIEKFWLQISLIVTKKS